MTSRAWATLLALGLAVGSLPAAAERESIALRDTLAERLGNDRIECPAALVPGLDTREAVCLETGLALKQLKKQIRGPLRGDAVVPLVEFDWNDLGSLREKRVFAGRELFVLRFHEGTTIVAMVPSHTCFGTAAIEGVLDASNADVTAPALAARPDPEYPEEARDAKQRGFAMMQLLVLEDGSVGAACPLYVAPAGHGFRGAARKAVAAYRFEPARRGDVAVPYRVNVSVTWEP